MNLKEQDPEIYKIIEAENTLPYTKEAIQSVLKGDYYSEYGWKNE